MTLEKIISFQESFIAIVGFFMISYTRSKGESLSIKMEGVGLTERAERVVIISLIILLFNYVNILFARVLFYILVVLVYLTFLQRFSYIYDQLRKNHHF